MIPRRLSSKREAISIKNAKTVARRLGASSVSTDTRHVRRVCEQLDERGQAHVGLRRFIEDVEAHAAPLFNRP